MKTVKQILTEAADHIEKVGWYQGHFYDDDLSTEDLKEAPCCILGAVRVVTDEVPWKDEEHLEYEAVLRVLTSHIGDVTSFNDRPWRTKEEVIAKLREIAGSL